VTVLKILAKTELEADKIRQLVEFYYGYRVYHIQNVRAVYKLETDHGIVAFKSAQKMKDIDFINSVIQHLHLHEFYRVPTLRKTKSDKLLLHYEHADYVVEQWLPAEVQEVNPYKQDWLYAAGKTIAQFHRAIATYPIPNIPKKRIRKIWGNWFLSKYKRIKEISQWQNSSTDRWFLARLKQAKNKYLLQPNITSHLCHGSLHQENIMMDSRSDVWLVDFERLTHDSISKDLAQVLMYHFRFHPWNQNDVNQLLTGYQSVSELSKADLFQFCTRNLVSDRMIYDYLDGKPVLEDQEQEWTKESILREVVPSYWK
jgi:Ser/Thr protein kinase RdoA (MazF antagonist)